MFHTSYIQRHYDIGYTLLFLFLLGSLKGGQDASPVFQCAPLMGKPMGVQPNLRLQPYRVLRNPTLPTNLHRDLQRSLPALDLPLKQLPLQAKKFSFEQKRPVERRPDTPWG